MTTEPRPAPPIVWPQVRFTVTLTGAPAITLNAMLVPEQLMPVLVNADIVTTSPVPAGRPTTTDGCRFGSLVLMVPIVMTVLVDESTFQSTALIVMPPGRERASFS